MSSPQFRPKVIHPHKNEITRKRIDLNMTQAECAALLYSDIRTWQRWESGESKMSFAFWEIFSLKVSQQCQIELDNDPVPDEIVKKRTLLHMTQAECAALLYTNIRNWQRWESGESKMPRALWELFNCKINKNNT